MDALGWAQSELVFSKAGAKGQVVVVLVEQPFIGDGEGMGFGVENHAVCWVFLDQRGTGRMEKGEER